MNTVNIKKRVFKKVLKKPNRYKGMVKCLRSIASQAQPGKWIFVLGCYNSGTTLLSKILSSHKRTSYLDEGSHYTDELTIPDELGWPRMWYEVEEKVKKQTGDKIAAKNTKKDWFWLFDNRKPVFIEKSISNIPRMGWLSKHFANSYFVHIIRNGYAVSKGIQKKAPKDSWKMTSKYDIYPIGKCASMWARSARLYELQASNIENTKTIKYEKLCENPKKVVRNIMKFIGLRGGISWSLDEKWNIHGTSNTIKNMNKKRLTKISSKECKYIEKNASRTLNKYGYK